MTGIENLGWRQAGLAALHRTWDWPSDSSLRDPDEGRGWKEVTHLVARLEKNPFAPHFINGLECPIHVPRVRLLR